MTWRPSASFEVLKKKQRLLGHIRQFFSTRKFLEVDLPVLGVAGTTDPQLHSFTTATTSPLFLQTSPEFFMKRLLAAGSGPIYSIGKAFRQEEQGRLHHREFTLLEWYQPGFDDHQLMDQVGELLQPLWQSPYELAIAKHRYRDLFEQQLNFNPHTVAVDLLDKITHQLLGLSATGESKSFYLDALFSHCIQPTLNGAIHFVYDYPAEQAALAKITEDENRILVARRFEVFIDGVELANGYWELTDPIEQERRFQTDNAARVQMGLAEIPYDQHLLEALKHGLPDSAGVALGIDRLLMLLCGNTCIDEVLAFRE